MGMLFLKKTHCGAVDSQSLFSYVFFVSINMKRIILSIILAFSVSFLCCSDMSAALITAKLYKNVLLCVSAGSSVPHPNEYTSISPTNVFCRCTYVCFHFFAGFAGLLKK